MKFESWLKKQKYRDDPIGDLAKDFIRTKCKSFMQSFHKFHPCDDAIKAYNRAKWEYDKFLKDKTHEWEIE